MTITTDISLFALIANGAYNSITANATAITAISVGGTTVNSTVYAGTANNANNLGGVAAASYALLAGPTFTGNTTVANLAFTSGARITGDFSNATIASRPIFQSSVTNGVTGVWAIPNGTAQIAAFAVSSSSDPGNASVGSFTQFSTDLRLTTTNTGTGTSTPMTFFTGGSERMRIDVAGLVGIGTSSPGARLDVASSSFNIVASRSTGGYAAFQRFAPAGQQAYDFYTINGVEAARITADGSNFLTFATGSAASERMRIDSAGNVGIGNTAPGQRLTVAGDISAAFYTNPTTISTNYTIPTNFNAMSIGPITVATGVTVTVPSGSTWVIT